MNNFFIIKWGNSFLDSFNYGTEIRTKKNGDVQVTSPLMPAGATIKTWKSKTQFHVDRESPSLPLLMNGVDYFLTVQTEKITKEDIQLKIRFFDEEQELIMEKYFHSLRGEFTYPNDATNYTIHLINKHINQMVFKEMILMTSELYDQYNAKKTENIYVFESKQNSPKKHTELIFIQGTTRMLTGTVCSRKKDYIFIFEAERSVKYTATCLFRFIQKRKRQPYVVKLGTGYKNTSNLFQLLPYVFDLLIPGSYFPEKKISNYLKTMVREKVQITKLATEILMDIYGR